MSSLADSVIQNEFPRCSKPGCIDEGLMYVRPRTGAPVVVVFCKTHAVREISAGGQFFGHVFSSDVAETATPIEPEISIPQNLVSQQLFFGLVFSR